VPTNGLNNIILKLFFFNVFLLCLILNVSAQRGKHWYFADSAALKFDASSITSLINSSLGNGQLGASCTTMSDTSGTLLFYNNGMDIWNKHHQIMLNGGNIANNGGNQIISIPLPNNDSIYYLFYNKYNSSAAQNSLYYTVINMNRQNGLGEVVQRNVLLQNANTTGISAISNINKRDYWIVTKYFYSPIFYSFKLTDTGIITQPIVSDFSTFNPIINLLGGCSMKTSPNGKLISINGEYFFYFNGNTGILDNPRRLRPVGNYNTFGYSFSPNSLRFYRSSGNSGRLLIQYSLDNLFTTSAPFEYNDSTEIHYAQPNSSSIWDMQIGADSKIYAIRYNSSRLSCISKPNDSSYNCQFVDTAIILAKGLGIGSLPNFISNINSPTLTLKVKQNTCSKFTFTFTSFLEGATYKQWAFGDNTFSNDSIAMHTYTNTADSFLVRFSIVPLGTTDTLKISRWVFPPKKPTTSFTMQYSGCTKSPVLFTGTTVQQDTATITQSAWLLGNGNSITNQNSFSYTYTDTGSYKVRFWCTDTRGCTSDTALQLVNINKAAIAVFTVSSPVCNASTITLSGAAKAYNSNISAVHYYYLNTGNDTILYNPTHTWFWKAKDTGIYTILQIASTNNGCVDSLQQSYTVLPNPLVSAGGNQIIVSGSSKILPASITGNSNGNIYNWQPIIDLNNANVLQPICYATASKQYKLTVTNTYGCNASDSLWVTVLKELKLPNSFSPNGDGINDQWDIPFASAYPNIKISVFNRNGTIVFQSTGNYTPWRGNDANNQPLPIGTYYYVIDLNTGEKPLAGWVSLIR
jgi:gliding motility-associated-like protein